MANDINFWVCLGIFAVAAGWVALTYFRSAPKKRKPKYETLTERHKRIEKAYEVARAEHKHKFRVDVVSASWIRFVCDSCPAPNYDSYMVDVGYERWYHKRYTINRYEYRNMLGIHKHRYKIDWAGMGTVRFYCQDCPKILVRTRHHVYELAWHGLNSKGKGVV